MMAKKQAKPNADEKVKPAQARAKAPDAPKKKARSKAPTSKTKAGAKAKVAAKDDVRKTPEAVALAEAEAAPQPLDKASPEAIRQRAYELYQQRGGSSGQDIDDWLQAERELRAGDA